MAADRVAARHAKAFLVGFASLLCLFGLPAGALAAEFTVTTTVDEIDATPGLGGCASPVNGCTLRAAVEESNFSTGVKDTIKFSAAFDGQLADTISSTGSFPAITDPVTIDGDGSGQCTTEAASVKGPCVGFNKTAGGLALIVEADGVVVEGMAVTGAQFGIDVLNASEGFVARNNWIGVRLDGSAGPNTTGIFLGPNSDGATIGGATAVARNVIANSSNEGLDIQGASSTQVSGNYLGVGPNGQVQAANGKNIEVTSALASEAVGNEIGAELSPEALVTAACDGACNVISGATSIGIDLLGAGGGEEPPANATTIEGNHIGLTASGAALGNATVGIQVGTSTETKIGSEAAASANHVNGGEYGISSGSAGVGADLLWVWGNLIGLNPAGTATLSPPSVAAISENADALTELTYGARIYDNRISMQGGVAIEHHGISALISGNQIGRGASGEALSAGTTGIRLWGPSVSGSTVERNLVEGATGSGILIESYGNLILQNTILNSGAAGIRIQDFLALPSTDNAIGGEVAGFSENTISGSGGDAIEVVGDEDDRIEIARNKGSGNAGLFIDLGADGPGNEASGPNDGIQPPVIATATESVASGSGARPGATVRVFRKATASPGELQSFLGKGAANAEGDWAVVYEAAVPDGTPIAATQTDEADNTSELALASVPAVVVDGGCAFIGTCGGGGGGGGSGGGGSNTDKAPPQTTIAKGPKGTIRATTARFRFTSSEPSSTFQCKLDGKPFTPCKSPKKYNGLKPGRHLFKVRALDAAGNVDPTPAKKKFRILG